MLAGVCVIFYVLLALRRKLRDAGGFDEGGPDLATLLDLVAVRTFADLVPLYANNRALVSAGLRRLRAVQGCAGLPALFEVSLLRAVTLSSADLRFAISPPLTSSLLPHFLPFAFYFLLFSSPSPS